jgi:hypothetical protein
MHHRLRKLVPHVARRGAALLALVGFLAGTLGVPLPAKRIAKDTSRPFPCQARQCGCMNAAQCWRECCCFTDKQKVVWAKANAVELPQFVLTAAQHETEPLTCRSACCSKKSPAQPVAASATELTLRFVLAIESRECHGQAEQWLTLGAVVLPPAPAQLTLVQPACGELYLREACLSSITLSPAAPPPRSLVVL